MVSVLVVELIGAAVVELDRAATTVELDGAAAVVVELEGTSSVAYLSIPLAEHCAYLP